MHVINVLEDITQCSSGVALIREECKPPPNLDYRSLDAKFGSSHERVFVKLL